MMGRLFMAATATMIVAAAAPARTAATPFQQDGTHSRSQLQSAVHFNEAGSTGGGGGGNVFRIGRALLADRCAGCEPELCFPATGCAACDVEAGYQPDGAGGCMKGSPATLAAAADPAGPNARTAASNPFSIHPLCGANAVLRAGGTGSVFGFGPVGATVAIRLMNSAGQYVAATSAKVDASGAWHGKLGNLKAGSPFVLTAQLGATKLMSRNIAVGHLLLASGQSNMFFSLGDIVYKYPKSGWAALAKKGMADAPKAKALRLFKVPLASSAGAKVTVASKWAVPTANYVGTFSAVAYLMGLRLQQALKVPVGIVQASYGGTSITQWISQATLATLHVPATSRTIARLNTYNTMIVPLRYADFSGVAWYQGESDGGLTQVTPIFAFYTRLLQALLRDWRALFANPNLRFEIVQVQLHRPRYAPAGKPSHAGLDHWPYVRESQRRVTLADPRADLVSVVDLGVDNQIHPPDKWDVATRLVRGVRKNFFGAVVVDSGPTLRSVSYKTRQAVVVFDNVGSSFVIGLKADNVGGVVRQPSSAAITCFQLRYRGRWYTAVGKIAGSRKATLSVVTTDRRAGRPDAVRYGWSDAAHCNLYNSGLLPAVPFTTDASYALGAEKAHG